MIFTYTVSTLCHTGEEKKNNNNIESKRKKNETSNQAPRMSIFNNFNRKLRNVFFGRRQKQVKSKWDIKVWTISPVSILTSHYSFFALEDLRNHYFFSSFSFWFVIFFPSIISRYYWTIPYGMSSGFVSFHLFAYVYCLLLCIEWMWSDSYCG